MFGIDEGISPNSAILSFFLVSCHLRFCYPAISSEFELAQTFSQLDMTTCVNASFEKVLSKFESNVTESIDFFCQYIHLRSLIIANIFLNQNRPRFYEISKCFPKKHKEKQCRQKKKH